MVGTTLTQVMRSRSTHSQKRCTLNRGATTTHAPASRVAQRLTTGALMWKKGKTASPRSAVVR